MVDLLDAYQWEVKLGGVAAERSAARIAELVADSEAAGITPVTNKSGSPLHFGEPYLGSVDVVELKAGKGGAFAYRELSGIAHATPTALIRRVREVPQAERPEGVTTALEGVRFASPAIDAANLVPVFGNVIGPYLDTLDAKVAVFGWNQSAWRYTRKNIMEGVLALTKQVARSDSGR